MCAVTTFIAQAADVAKVHASTQPMVTAGPDVEALRVVGGLGRDPPVPEALPRRKAHGTGTPDRAHRQQPLDSSACVTG
jgi:hypothetical protein